MLCTSFISNIRNTCFLYVCIISEKICLYWSCTMFRSSVYIVLKMSLSELTDNKHLIHVASSEHMYINMLAVSGIYDISVPLHSFQIWGQSSRAAAVSCVDQSVVVLCHIRLRLGRTVVDIVERHMIGVSHLCAALHRRNAVLAR